MTTVVTVFGYQGKLTMEQARQLGESYTNLGVRKIEVDEKQGRIAVEYDATRMDQNGVSALLRRLRIPITPAVVG
jgi:hypothetical protein